MLKSNVPNIIAMICSLTAMIQLVIVAQKFGGGIGKVFKLLVVGIFFAVFVHATVELTETYVPMTNDFFLLIMGTLITIGSAIFVIAGALALKILKK